MTYDPCADHDPIPAYYAGLAPPAPGAPLAGSHEADVLVIGGGFTGCSTALHLAEQGVRVILLEAKEIGAGASSRNFGQVVPYLKPGHASIRKDFPPEVAERMITRVGRGPDLVFGLIERHAIQCQPRRNGLLFAAHAASGVPGLEARTRFWQERGENVRMYGAAETEELVGSRYYRACSVDYRGGTINPAGYVRGLAHAAAKCGAMICVGALAEPPERVDGKWRVRAPGGQVTADHVVLATNAYTAEKLWPGLRESIIPVRGYALASAPLSDNLRGSLLRGGQPLTDTRRTHSGMRLNEDGRLHSSTLGPPFDIEGTHDMTRLHRRVTTVFPQLDGVQWEHRWCGWIALSQDHYPHLHALAPGLWAGLGYTGRGIAAATLMGQDIASHILGRPGEETTFPVRGLKQWWMVPFARSVVAAGIAYHRLRDKLDERQNARERSAA